MPNTSPSDATILIVDDDAGIVRLIEKTLRREGFQTASASSGHGALLWVDRHRADLMLLDLKLQDIEARELIDRLRQLPLMPPFVVITGQGDERVAVEMMKCGALDYLVKDAQFLELLPAVVRRTLAEADKDRRLAAAEEALRHSERNLAKAQEIAQLGSYELFVGNPAADQWSAEIFRILARDPSSGPLPPDEFIRVAVHPADRQSVESAIERARTKGESYNIDYRILRKDGATRHVHTMGEAVRDAAGVIRRIVGTLQDVTERKRLEKEILDISDREQRRIGQDLHDGLGQHLAGIELMSQVLEQRLAGARSKEASNLATEAGKISHHVREAISQARALARGLSPVVIESEGLMAALQQLADSASQMFRIRCEFECDPPVLVTDHTVATHLYRIAQEAVSNAVKHGRTKDAQIRLRASGERIVLIIKDRGVGLPERLPSGKGMGLRIMQYRAGIIGGSVVVQRDPEGGTSVICSIQNAALQPANLS